MPNPVSNLNSAQILQVAKATSREEATKMSLLDRIIDWFKSGVQRAELEQMYDKLIEVKGGAASSHESNFHTENIRLNAFAELRQLALPEHRDQFKYDFFSGDSPETFGCAIRIGGEEIYRNNDISGPSSSHERFELTLGKCGMDLEDAFRNEDTDSIRDVLKAVSGEVRRTASGMDNADIDSTPQPSPEALSLLMRPLSTGAQAMLLSKLTEDLGLGLMVEARDNDRQLLQALTETLTVTMERLAEENAAKQDSTRVIFDLGKIQG
ncbi:hypothetical protein BOTU111921_05045 [Bordetella tumbae]